MIVIIEASVMNESEPRDYICGAYFSFKKKHY